MAKEEADWFRLLFSSKHKKIDLKNEFLKIMVVFIGKIVYNSKAESLGKSEEARQMPL